MTDATNAGDALPPLLYTAARCPTCGTPPRIRAYPRMLELVGSARAEEPLQTYQCHRRVLGNRLCNTVYRITAGHIQRALAVKAVA